MDLETIIPLVIVAVAYLFKAFENARKEGKKKRRPAPKPPPSGRKATAPARPLVADRSSEMPQTSETRRRMPELSRNPEIPARPAIPAAESQPEGRWWWEEMTTAVPAADNTGQPDKAGQMEKSRPSPAWQSRKKTGRQKQPSGGIPPRPVAEPGAAVLNEYADFDLEDAVIKAVILERREF